VGANRHRACPPPSSSSSSHHHHHHHHHRQPAGHRACPPPPPTSQRTTNVSDLLHSSPPDLFRFSVRASIPLCTRLLPISTGRVALAHHSHTDGRSRTPLAHLGSPPLKAPHSSPYAKCSNDWCVRVSTPHTHRVTAAQSYLSHIAVLPQITDSTTNLTPLLNVVSHRLRAGEREVRHLQQQLKSTRCQRSRSAIHSPSSALAHSP
jgi:hypothetical protein